MALNSSQLSQVFRKISDNDGSYNEALEIVRQNANGRIWLIGGFLYKSLANYLYGTSKPSKDFDFIVEFSNQQIILPDNWSFNKSRFGNPKFIKLDNNLEIDFVPLEKVHSIIKRKLKPTIKNYLLGVPLNIHYLAYDPNGLLEGETGLLSLEEKVVRVNDLEMAQDAARLYFTNVNEIIKKKALELGFREELV